ncbi:MAG: TetR/AcrR family transcriptional regulator [Kofleriaceae bacterium]|nr:TetR/AcrR family transcriptional regulator [Kofleriaceae bacterium]
MGRPRGTRNARFLATRKRLVTKLARRLAEPGGASASMRQLAATSGVSVSTLQHYFGDRAGVVTAVLESAHRAGQSYLDEVACGFLPPLRASLSWFVDYIVAGLVEGKVGELHELGLAAGFRDDKLGPAYLNHILEPTLQALEARLARHLAAGDLRPCDLRVAAIHLLAPLLVAVLHQYSLGGQQCRPLPMRSFIDHHIDMFLRAYEEPRVVPAKRR